MKYEIFKHNIKIEDKTVETYGIRICDNKNVIDKLYDVSTDYNAISQLVDSLNKNRIDFIHFNSILEDFYLDNV